MKVESGKRYKNEKPPKWEVDLQWSGQRDSRVLLRNPPGLRTLCVLDRFAYETFGLLIGR